MTTSTTSAASVYSALAPSSLGVVTGAAALSAASKDPTLIAYTIDQGIQPTFDSIGEYSSVLYQYLSDTDSLRGATGSDDELKKIHNSKIGEKRRKSGGGRLVSKRLPDSAILRIRELKTLSKEAIGLIIKEELEKFDDLIKRVDQVIEAASLAIDADNQG